MKKVISVLMSILIVALSFSFVVAAEAPKCECTDHNFSGECRCCVYCENLPATALRTCVMNADGTLKKNEDGVVETCCKECNGLTNCTCTCGCCPANGSSEESGELLNPEQQEAVISTFQGVLARVREFFDKIFNAIFEFLRFDEIMGA
ncbi:MAG: hypothetical protein IKV21_02800 [Clostridia bacterium]|nr:hypothetical protein [Clostridia bacterium]